MLNFLDYVLMTYLNGAPGKWYEVCIYYQLLGRGAPDIVNECSYLYALR